MKSVRILFACAAITLVGCTQSDEIQQNQLSQFSQDSETPVSFSTYSSNSGVSRAGQPGSITTEILKGEDYGFGVFAYYTKASNWADVRTTAIPDWMWNQKVYWDADANDPATGAAGGAWVYEPLKFWPNDNTDADNAGAMGTTSSKISFFAYGPYAGDATTGEIPANQTSGIISVTDNGTEGNPKVTYRLAKDGKNVDLLWGTGVTEYNTVDGGTIIGEKAEDAALAPTNINITKLKVGEKIKFNFKHALAKIGGGLQNIGDDTTPGSTSTETTNHGLQVQLDIDKEGNIKGGEKPASTKVTVKTIKIENNNATAAASGTAVDMTGDGSVTDADYIYGQGTLDLATGIWTVDNSTSSRTDINHVVTSENSDAADKTASSASLSSLIAEPETFTDFASLPAGVLTTPQNVYGSETNPLVFLPGTKPAFKVTITYIVRTEDKHLKSGYTEAEQTISKYVTFPEIELNKRYNLVMHLGLTSIKFTATVEDWATDVADPDGDADNDGIKNSEDPDYNTEVTSEVNLPINVN